MVSPYFSWKKTVDLFQSSLSAKWWPPIFPRRLSSVLSKFSHKNVILFGCHPLDSVTRGGLSVPSVTPLPIKYPGYAHGCASFSCLTCLSVLCHIQLVADSNRRRLRSSSSMQLRSDVHGCPLSATVRFRWPDAAFGTVYHPMSRQLQRSLFFGIASRHTSSQDLLLHNF